MRAGRLNRRITIQQFKSGRPVQDATGDTTPDELSDTAWEDRIHCWANQTSMQGREFFAVRQEQAEVTHLFECRYIPDIKPRMRVVETISGTTKKYDIKSVIDPDGRRRRLLIAAQELI